MENVVNFRNRENDIYWCLYSKKNEFIGTVRIYDIDEEKSFCTQGSFMIGEEYSESVHFALEAEILSLDFVFNILKIKNAVNEDCCDNKVMNNLSKKLGFKLKKNKEWWLGIELNVQMCRTYIGMQQL